LKIEKDIFNKDIFIDKNDNLNEDELKKKIKSIDLSDLYVSDIEKELKEGKIF